MPSITADIMGATIIIAGVILILYRKMTDPIPKPKLYPYGNRCHFCQVKGMKVLATCSGEARKEDCAITRDHLHVQCKNCKAIYLMRFRGWIDDL